MNFQEGAYIYINKPYRMSSFGALVHIRYVLSKRLHVKRVKMGHAGTLVCLFSVLGRLPNR